MAGVCAQDSQPALIITDFTEAMFNCCCVAEDVEIHQISPCGHDSIEVLQKPSKSAASFAAGGISARSQGSAPSTARSLSPDERSNEKRRLQEMVHKFAKDVVVGQPCEFIRPGVDGAAAMQPATFSLDKSLQIFVVCPQGGDSVSINLTDMDEMIRDIGQTPFSVVMSAMPQEDGFQLSRRFMCVQYAAKPGGITQLCGFFLPSQYERERFHTCMKILRWAMDTPVDKQTTVIESHA